MEQVDLGYDILVLIFHILVFFGIAGISCLIYFIPPVRRFFERMDNDFNQK